MPSFIDYLRSATTEFKITIDDSDVDVTAFIKTIIEAVVKYA